MFHFFPQSEPQKEKEKITLNHSQNTSDTNMSLPRPKTFHKEQVVQRESAINSSTWLKMAWNGFYSTMEAFIKWLYIGIEWPKDINSDMFARRTVTGADLTCPADGVRWWFSCFINMKIPGVQGGEGKGYSIIESKFLF